MAMRLEVEEDGMSAHTQDTCLLGGLSHFKVCSDLGSPGTSHQRCQALLYVFFFPLTMKASLPQRSCSGKCNTKI
jgi:hypothetical protein